MRTISTKTLAFYFLICLNARAQGTAIITLVAPPPGGDGYNALQTGAAFAEGASSLYYNPATLAELDHSTESQLQLSYSHQQLLPVLNLGDLNQQFWGVSGDFPDKDGFDVGIGFFRNEVNFGNSLLVSTDTGTQKGFDANENVYALGIALRLGIPVSMGGTAKFYASLLGPEQSQQAYGWSFDLGILASPRFHPPPKWNWPYMELTPSAALVLQNLGPDASYSSSDYPSDPIPTTFRFSMGLEMELFDFAGITVGEDREYSIFRGTPNLLDQNPVLTNGISWRILCFRSSLGLLDDPSGQRHERHDGEAFEFNMIQLDRVFERIARKEFFASPDELDRNNPLYPFKKINLGGFSYLPNPRFIIGVSRIHAYDSGIRNGQRAFYWSVSI